MAQSRIYAPKRLARFELVPYQPQTRTLERVSLRQQKRRFRKSARRTPSNCRITSVSFPYVLLKPGFAVHARRTSLGQPKYILVIWRRYVSRRRAGRRSARVEPFPDLRMAIHKRNTASAVMIAGGKIHYVSRSQSGGHLNGKPSVVDAV